MLDIWVWSSRSRLLISLNIIAEHNFRNFQMIYDFEGSGCVQLDRIYSENIDIMIECTNPMTSVHVQIELCERICCLSTWKWSWLSFCSCSKWIFMLMIKLILIYKLSPISIPFWLRYIWYYSHLIRLSPNRHWMRSECSKPLQSLFSWFTPNRCFIMMIYISGCKRRFINIALLIWRWYPVYV